MEVLEALQKLDDTNFVVVKDGHAELYDKRVYRSDPQRVDDMLDLLLKKQLRLQTDFMHYSLDCMSEKERGEYVREYTLYCIDEFSEMLHEIPFFKLWKKYSDDPADNALKWQKARMEFVDALHFFLNIALGLGFTAEELFQMYEDKYQENIKRQQNTTEYKPSADAT